jgi:DNA-binding XRE family transcriptional regulator
MTRSRKADRLADPAEIIRAREAAGLTQEQLADEMGVLPAEVAAWEAGAIAASIEQGGLIRRAVGLAEHRKRLAEVAAPRCSWMLGQEKRFARLEQRSPRTAAWVARTTAAHQRGCPVCREAQALTRHLPAPEVPRTAPSPAWLDVLSRRVAKLPAWLRIPVKSAAAGLAAGSAWFVSDTLTRWLENPRAGLDPSPAVFVWTTLVVAWMVLTRRVLRPLGDRRPYLAGQTLAAVLVSSGVFAWAQVRDIPEGSVGLWIMAAIISGLLGLVLGAWYDPEPEGS